MALAHGVSNKVEAAYRKGDLFDRRRALAEDWAAYCVEEMSRSPSETVGACYHRAMNKFAEPRKKTAQSDKGFDFGTPLNYLSVPNIEWANQITQSQVVGCAYGWQKIPELGAHIPSISLIARSAALIRSAFEEFDRWTKGSDDDAVEMNIVLLKNGGYLLGISREPSRALALSPVPAFFDAVHLVQSWIKTIDTTNKTLLDLREYCRALIAPVAVGPVLMPPLMIVPDARVPMRSVEGVRPLVKFQLDFGDEDQEDLPPTAKMMLQVHRSSKDGGRHADQPAERTPSMWGAKRSNVLREMFPLSVFRSKRRGLPELVRGQLRTVKVADWQIEQAVCNLVMSKVIGSTGGHYNGISSKGLVDKIASAAAAYSEIADGRDNLEEFGPADIARQLWLDADYLVGAVGERARDGSLSSRQSILQRRGYLEKQ